MSTELDITADLLVRYFVRAREAEKLVAELSIAKGEALARVAELEKMLVPELKADEAWKWGRKVGDFLLKALRHKPGHSFDLREGSRLYTDAIALGIIPEPDCRPGKIQVSSSAFIKPGDGCPCPPDPTEFCPRCGGRIIPDLMMCGNIHDSGAGPTQCALAFGHLGPHESADKRERWV